MPLIWQQETTASEENKPITDRWDVNLLVCRPLRPRANLSPQKSIFVMKCHDNTRLYSFAFFLGHVLSLWLVVFPWVWWFLVKSNYIHKRGTEMAAFCTFSYVWFTLLQSCCRFFFFLLIDWFRIWVILNSTTSCWEELLKYCLCYFEGQDFQQAMLYYLLSSRLDLLILICCQHSVVVIDTSFSHFWGWGVLNLCFFLQLRQISPTFQ